MAEVNLADKRRKIQSYIGSLERGLDFHRGYREVFQSRAPKVTAYMELEALHS